MNLKHNIYLITLLFISTSFAQEQSKKIEKSDLIVYITKDGSRYHKDTCRYLSKSKIPITLGEASKKKYSACKVCKPPELCCYNILSKIWLFIKNYWTFLSAVIFIPIVRCIWKLLMQRYRRKKQ